MWFGLGAGPGDGYGGCDLGERVTPCRRSSCRPRSAISPLIAWASRRPFPEKAGGPFNRVALAAAHVVADPLADIDPWLDVAIDWDRTIAYREHLWDLGLGVAEAMDTAQRGMGLDWTRLARADPPQPRSGSVAPGRRRLLRRRHRPPGAFVKAHHRRRDPRLRRADLGNRAAGRADRAHGQPRACRLRALPGRLRQGLQPDSRPAARAVHHPLAGRDVRPGARGLFRQPRPHGRDGRLRRDHRRTTSPRSTASSCPCSTRRRRSCCAPACPRACACTPATTSTTPS